MDWIGSRQETRETLSDTEEGDDLIDRICEQQSLPVDMDDPDDVLPMRGSASVGDIISTKVKERDCATPVTELVV